MRSDLTGLLTGELDIRMKLFAELQFSVVQAGNSCRLDDKATAELIPSPQNLIKIHRRLPPLSSEP